MKPLGVIRGKKELKLAYRIEIEKKQDCILTKQAQKTSSLITHKGRKNTSRRSFLGLDDLEEA